MKYFLSFFIILNFFFFDSKAIVPVTDGTYDDHPPAQNPHPPVTEADKKRVEFAGKVVSILLESPLSVKAPDDESSNFENKNLECVSNKACYSKDKAFAFELASLHHRYGEVSVKKHGHIVPWAFKRFQGIGGSSKVKKPVLEQAPSEIDPDADKNPPMGYMGPSLKNDEYVVHFYVQFGISQTWYHLSVVLTENKNGNLFLRHFHVYEMKKGTPPVC